MKFAVKSIPEFLEFSRNICKTTRDSLVQMAEQSARRRVDGDKSELRTASFTRHADPPRTYHGPRKNLLKNASGREHDV